jgi:hypothetical protein
MGGDKPIRELSTDDVKGVRDALTKLPPNYMKATANKGKSVVEAITAFGRVLAWDHGTARRPDLRQFD